MVKTRKKKDQLYDVLDKYYRQAHSAGKIPILIVDTGTIIDIEERARELRCKAPHRTARQFFLELGSLANYVVFPDGIYKEIIDHHLKSKINGRSEIGEEIYREVEFYNEKSRDILDQLRFDYFYSEPFRNEVDRLQKVIEKLHTEVNLNRRGGKKVYGKDPISSNDLELLNTALRLAVKSLFKFRLCQNEKGGLSSAIEWTYRIAVVSPDSHIYKPLNTLTERLDNISYRDHLQAFNSRENK